MLFPALLARAAAAPYGNRRSPLEEKLAYMRADDGIYGGASSVVWKHA